MIARFLRSEHGSPSAEFALILPAIIVLLFGGFESGNFMWTQHRLVEAARQGARYASRLPIDKFCNGTSENLDADAENAIQILTATGRMPDSDGAATAPVRVDGMTAANVQVVPDCDGFSAKGIYTQLGTAGPTIRVSTGPVGYQSLFQGLGVINTVTLSARSDSAVIGI